VNRSLLFPMTATALIAFALAAGFASHQSLWVDETTQLAGIRMPLSDTFHFLLGHPAPAQFDVPADRMPPLSYLVDKVWALLFGPSETSLRYLGILLFSLTTALTAASAACLCRQSTGNSTRPQLAAWLAGLAMATAPSCITLAPEIRAYPLFHCLAAAATLLLILHLTAPARWHLPALTALLIAAIYTHYFGVVFTGAVCVALFLGTWQLRQPLRPALLLAAVVALSSLGLIPFLKQAVGMSSADPTQSVITAATHPLSAILGLWVRFGAHGATQTITGLVCVAVAAFTLITAAASICLVRARRSHAAALPLLALIASGLAVIAVATLIARGFNPASVAYNVWVFPPLYAAIGAGVALTQRRLALIVTAIWLATTTYTSLFLSIRGDLFAHGSNPAIVSAIETLGVDQLTVLHTGQQDGGFRVAYYPLRYRYGDQLKQQIMQPKAPPPTVTTPFVLLVFTRSFSSEELARYWKTRQDPAFDDTAALASMTAAGYRVIHRRIAPSFQGCEIILMAKEPQLPKLP
jgi:uncharacterized membrane protein